MGLLVDFVKSNFGYTNDGNIARRFFANSKISADLELIDNFGLVLRVLSSGKKINAVSFQDLINETRSLYMKYYGWYNMPATVHKELAHGCAIIKFFDLPRGSLSEEALEAKHKELRKIRLHHTRKNSREAPNKDLLNYLLVSSDPYLSSKRERSKSCNIFTETQIQPFIYYDS